MDSKIQQLTETIYKEGLQKVREEEAAIIKAAKDKGSGIENDAKKEAERIIAEANEKATEIKKQVDSELKMAVNQAVSAMKQEITSLITMKVLQPPVKEIFSDKGYIQSLISTVVKGWLEKENFDLNVILPDADREKMERYFKNNLLAELNSGLNIQFSHQTKSGFKIGPADDSYVISFTDEDFINFLKGYLRPKSSQLLFEEEK